jgi:TolB-like protein
VAEAAKGQTVAVMPFRDLSGGTRFVGEAIRETVTSDLRQFGALRVVERGSLDKVMAEQGLQRQQQDFDTATVVKLGKVVGASLILVGAYQKLAPQVRLTARFIKVETSEVIGTAKVDGSSREFLRLQDRVTSALLQSAGFPIHAKQLIDDSSKRPELANLQTLELYGQALTADNDVMRRQFLSLAVASDQSFSYAVKDLAELEKRLKAYAVTARATQDRELAAIREQLRTTTDRAAIEQLTYKMIALLSASRRYHGVVREARTFLEALPAGAPITQSVDTIAVFMMGALLYLRDGEALLREGERYLQRAPGSPSFESIKVYMTQMIAQKRDRQAGAAAAELDISQLSEGDERWDLCALARIYSRHSQYEAAIRLTDACAQVTGIGRKDMLPILVNAAFATGDWPNLRKLSSEWQTLDSPAAEKWLRSSELLMPTDE